MKRILTNTNSHQNRRGIAILWLILWGSLFLTFFCVVLEIATLWQAQIEINNALDSAALAAVKEWGDSGTGSTQIPRNVGVAYTQANPILGVAFTPNTNFTPPVPGNPNGNASNTGNLVFGAIDSITDPIIFNGNADASCAAGGVTITITQLNNGNSADPNTIRLGFDSGTNLAIDSVAFTLPLRNGGPPNAQAFFASGTDPQVSTVIGTFSGVDVDPTNPGPPNWDCPNPNGDVCFTFEDLISPGEFRTVRINFDSNSFTATDFLHFGVSTNQLGPPGYTPPPMPNNVGNAWGEFGVTAEVTFRNTITNVTSTATATFVNQPANGVSQATLTGGAGGFPAVIAQATVPVQGFCTQVFGVNFFNASASSIAYYDCGTGRAALVSVDNIIFP
ncbi:TadE/TadG family type IV pilus assembly protein [Gimesia aquarii]|uniref:Uncharacterized protein n=1 Tax=Gimesia aquarii TaxID=2527964 RepID=A0A517W0N9_9PLAN|nr:hypothetical protein [Gimesia aquarii]QDT98825.1 hypothetical protein V144x_43340 [Gimesia aquarii]